MNINEHGLKILKSFEGCKLEAYLDIVNVPTIGYGATGPDIKLGLKWTQQQCEDRLKADLKKFETAVLAHVKIKLNSNQFSALVVFSYNVGVGAFSTSTLLKKLNRGDFTGASAEFLRWNKAGGKEVAGLTRRRKAEQELFNKPIEVESKKNLLSDGPSDDEINDVFANIEKVIL